MKNDKLICFMLVICDGISPPIYAEETASEKVDNNSVLSGNSLTLLDVAKMAVTNSPDIKRRSLNLDIAKASERIQTGTFDFNTHVTVGYHNDRMAIGNPPYNSYVVRDDRDYQNSGAGISKFFRSGIAADLSISMNRMDPRDVPPPPPPIHTDNTTAVTFTLNIPLLKGRGYVSAAADETAARLEREATGLEVQQFIASILLDAVGNYWEYKNAIETLKVYERSEQRVSDWIAMGKTSGRLEGYLSDKKRQVVTARDAVNTAKSNLASSLGIPANQVDNLGEPVSEFPLDWESVLAQFDQQASKNKWLNKALAQRLDLQAAKLRQQASETLVAKAKRDSLPSLDLSLSLGYNGYEAGNGTSKYFDSLYGYVQGANSGASLTLSYPLGNNTAKGVLDLKRALDQQNKITIDELTRQISLEIGVSASNVVGTLSSAVESAKTAESYYNSLQQLTEDKEFINNPDKIFNTVDLEDKLITALLDHYNSLNELAKTIVNVRYQTGTLIIPNDTAYEVKLEDLTSLLVE